MSSHHRAPILSSTRAPILGALAVALLSSCALLYDFGETGGAAAVGTTGTEAMVTGIGATTSGAMDLPLGAPCAIDASCASDHCANEVCCDTACTGACEACSPAGVCAPVPQETPCGASSCTMGVLRPAATCASDGTCVQGEDIACVGACAGNVCDGCVPGGCADNEYCPPAGGGCVPKKDLGSPCIVDLACASGACTDDVCCNATCLGACESCNADGLQGICTPNAAGTDPGNECPNEGGCGRTGECKGGEPACAVTAAPTVCAQPACANAMSTPQRTCDGAGTCVQVAPTPCPGNLACNAAGTACLDACTGNAECVGGTVCVSGSCILDGDVGDTCFGDQDCLNANCADGFCCENACIGQCLSCAKSDTDQPNGRCRAMKDGNPDPLCFGSLPRTCGNNGLCEAGECQKHPLGTECGDTCNGNQYFENTCDGMGSCVLTNTVNCMPSQICCLGVMSQQATCLMSGDICNMQ